MKHKTIYYIWAEIINLNEERHGHWVKVTKKEFERFLIDIQSDFNVPFIQEEREEFRERQIRIRLVDETWIALITIREVD